MFSTRNQMIEFIDRGVIPAERIRDALMATKVIPDGRSWRGFIDQIMLWVGGLSLAFAVMFFIAYNWNDISRFTKFGMMEGVIFLAIVAYCRFDEHTVSSKVALLVATIFLGVLLALYGQTYQTGVDPWQLFFSWAMLMLPWAIVGCFPAIWIVWTALINITIITYYQTFGMMFWSASGTVTGMLWLIFSVNTLLLAAWELLAKNWRWLSKRWAIRTVATGSGVPLTWLVIHTICERRDEGFLSGVVWLVWIILMYVVYRRIKPDLFMLAGCCLSGITVSILFLARHMLTHGTMFSFFLLAVLATVMGAGSVVWLKSVHQEFQS